MEHTITLTDDQETGLADELATINKQRDLSNLPPLTADAYIQDTLATQADQMFVRLQKRQRVDQLKALTGVTSDEEIASLLMSVGFRVAVPGQRG